jgi:predicted DNA-binding protein
MATTQISAHIAEETKERLDRFVRRSGQTRTRVIEDALLQHLQALEELPADVLVPARVVLTAESAALVRDAITRPPKPTKDMKRLLDDR